MCKGRCLPQSAIANRARRICRPTFCAMKAWIGSHRSLRRPSDRTRRATNATGAPVRRRSAMTTYGFAANVDAVRSPQPPPGGHNVSGALNSSSERQTAQFRPSAADRASYVDRQGLAVLWPRCIFGFRPLLPALPAVARKGGGQIMPEGWIHMMESSMRFLPIAAAMLLLGGAPAMSQVAPIGPAGSPGMGTTSPLGGTGSVGQLGIPLGSTELDPGGLSPPPLGSMTGTSLCGTNGMSVTATGTPGMGGSGTAGSGSTFDGGGTSGVSGPCGSVPLGGTVSGTQSPSAFSGTTAGSTLGIGTIPLGATELGSAGISPMVPVPAPTLAPTLNPSASPTLNSSSPCVGSGVTTPGTLGNGTTMGTPGMSSPLGC
jgi:hypothetical protein